ncbi:MAG: LytTR family DNA-binding domain-containing protein [Desulfonauticus sp.]|nr:LytTR family DNA-binding domain-containing protein [Desulfonauticus sp.]
MPEVKILLVLPEQEISQTIRDFLANEKSLKILGEAKTAFEALALLENIPYELFFISTNLSGGVDGFELAQILNQRKQRPKVVFIAPNKDLAFKAFEVGAVDYLLWPFSRDRLLQSIERITTSVASLPSNRSSKASEDNRTVHLELKEEEEVSILKALKDAWQYKSRPKEIEKLPINHEGKLILIPYHKIVFIEAYEDYSYVHTASERYLTSYRLKHLEDKLSAYNFFRIHRKYLVNLELVTEIASLPGSTFVLRTTGKKKIELPISRRRISELKSILGL